jgi:hypothetical protein
MSTKTSAAIDKKQSLLDQIKKIQSKIDNIEKQRADKINKLAKKFKLFDLDDKILEQEFSLIKEKHLAVLEKNQTINDIKKN